MSDFIILILIVILIICLIVTLVGFVLYSGLLSEVDIKTGSPPIRNVTIAYKFKEGSYKDCGAVYTESCSIAPKLSTIGIFYDDPKQTPAEKCRYVVGSILSEGEEKTDEELQKLYEKFGFKVFSLPEVTHAVTTSFPSTTPLSHILGPYRVYPGLSAYIECPFSYVTHMALAVSPHASMMNKEQETSKEFYVVYYGVLGFPSIHGCGWMNKQHVEIPPPYMERKLCAFPTIEICKADLTHYMVPLSRQTDFFVPEMREEAKTVVKEEDSDEDRGTDITGADSHSDVSSVSGGVPWDSRETSLAASTAASLASSLPLRDTGDTDEHTQHKDHSDRGSNESVGSGSSFEELDLELVESQEGGEEKEEEEAEKGGPVVEGGARESPLDPMTEEREPLGEGEE